jgi:hypothetical protein
LTESDTSGSPLRLLVALSDECPAEVEPTVTDLRFGERPLLEAGARPE